MPAAHFATAGRPLPTVDDGDEPPPHVPRPQIPRRSRSSPRPSANGFRWRRKSVAEGTPRRQRRSDPGSCPGSLRPRVPDVVVTDIAVPLIGGKVADPVGGRDAGIPGGLGPTGRVVGRPVRGVDGRADLEEGASGRLGGASSDGPWPPRRRPWSGWVLPPRSTAAGPFSLWETRACRRRWHPCRSFSADPGRAFSTPGALGASSDKQVQCHRPRLI